MFESARKRPTTILPESTTASLRLPGDIGQARCWQNSLDRFIERNSALDPPEAMEAAAKLIAGRYSDKLLGAIESAAALSPELAKIQSVVHRARELGEQSRDFVAPKT